MDPQSSDADLVCAVRGDPAAFELLYRRYLPAVYRYIYVRVGSVADAEDIAASAFLDVLTSLRNYREQGHFAAWLFTIVHRHVGAHYRRQRRDNAQQAFIDDDTWERLPGGAEPSEAGHLEQAQLLDRAMTRLSADQREALALRFYGGLPVAEIARVMGKGESAVKMILHRGLLQLKTGLTQADPDPGPGRDLDDRGGRSNDRGRPPQLARSEEERA